MDTKTFEWITIGVAGVGMVGLLAANSIVKSDLNRQLVDSKVSQVVEVHDTQIDHSTYGEYGVADVRPATIIVTTAGRYLVEGLWQGLPGEDVQVRWMRGGDVLICREKEPCQTVQN